MEDRNIFDKVHEVDLKATMETSYIDYAMSVIVSRALPDVRDGLKPVQRRILYSMTELNNGPDKPHRKCARIVGDTMGKYHPHGDSSIYGALVNLAQDWNTRYPLVDGHGNFGSVDGDGAAAMRYTEARMSKISMEMIADLHKDTVDFSPNFDETEKEPTILPSRFPNILVNGGQGIAVGMATNIPPHNLTEVCDAVLKMIENQVECDRDTSMDELIEIVKGPDFPTGAAILGRKEIEKAYRTGRGKIKVRAVTNIEPMNNGKQRIVVTQLPYMVNKARLIEKIAELVKLKKVDGITELRDESDRQGMRICIETRKDVNANVLLKQLFRHTQLQDTFGVIMLALVDNQPKVLNLKELLVHYLNHQKDVVTRRTRFDLKKAEERAHILEGLLKALDAIDEIIKTIRASASVAQARESLVHRFDFSEVQAQAIVDMRLRALTGLEKEKLQKEYDELEQKIQTLKAILADEKVLLGVIRDELIVLRDKYGDARRTSIELDTEDLSDEDLIPKQDAVITVSKLGYIKRMTLDNFQIQNRGGRGVKGMNVISEDHIDRVFMTHTHDYIWFFTNQGKVYRLKGYEIPEAGRTARGTNIVNLLQLQEGEKISTVISVERENTAKYVVLATKNGVVKKTSVADYANIRKVGLNGINLREGDDVVDACFVDNDDDLFLVSKKGLSVRFDAKDAREVGRASIGVIGMKLMDGDEVVAMQTSRDGKELLVVSENGIGKRTNIDEFPKHNRAVKGVKCYRITEKTGDIVGAKMLDEENEIILINTQGIMIRISTSNISVNGRNASGVTLIRMGENVKVAGVSKVKITEETDNV